MHIYRKFPERKRKKQARKEGILGVEGVSQETIIGIKNAEFKPGEIADKRTITKQDLFCEGLYGKQNSRYLRTELLKELQLPSRLSANNLDILNAFYL